MIRIRSPRPSPKGRRAAPFLVTVALAGLAAEGAIRPVQGQEPTDSLRAEVARLAALVDSLRAEVDRLRAAGQEEEAADALADLRAAAAAAAAAGGDPAPSGDSQAFVGRQRSLQALNPEISLNADVMAHLNPDDTDADNFFPREFELSFISALDPFSRAALYISRHGEGPEVVPFGEDGHAHDHEEEEGHGGGFEVEEGYVEWVSLPGGLGFKLGKFQQQITSLNRWHAHALPFQSRSLPHLAFFGEEALSQSGASVSWLLPLGGGGAGTYQVTFEATRSGNETLWGEAASPNYMTNARAFYQLGEAVDVEFGGSWLTGHLVEDGEETLDRSVRSAEMAFNWIPPARSRQRGLTVRAGWMQLVGLEEHDHAGDPEPEDEEEHDRVDGFWSMLEMRLSNSWLIGARFDRVANPAEPDVTQWLFSPTLTWWQSEFVRIRAEYDVLSGIEGGDGTGMFVLQATFAMGPHKHATY